MKKITVCIDMNERSIENYNKIFKEMNWADIDEIHLVHAFEQIKYTDTFYMVSYPQESEHSEIEKSVYDILDNLAQMISEKDQHPIIIKKCLFSGSPKDEIVNYSNENDIDEMIISTRGKKGLAHLFSSSFAEFMVRHAPCTLRIFRDS